MHPETCLGGGKESMLSAKNIHVFGNASPTNGDDNGSPTNH